MEGGEKEEKHYLLLAAHQQGRVQSPGYLPLCILVVESSDKSTHGYEKMPEKNNTHTKTNKK